LRRLGCEQIGFMDDFAKAEVTLAFVHRDRKFLMRFPGRGSFSPRTRGVIVTRWGARSMSSGRCARGLLRPTRL
jgi:hypothetical protein